MQLRTDQERPPKDSFMDARRVHEDTVTRNSAEAAPREAFDANSSNPSHSKKRADTDTLAISGRGSRNRNLPLTLTVVGVSVALK